MTLALGRRFIIVDGVERWKDKDLDALEAALGAIAPETTVAFFAREDSRTRAPERLHAIVSEGGRRHQRREQRQAVGAAQVGRGPCARAGDRARPGGRAGADPARRRPPAAAAARAREARARDRATPSGRRSSTPPRSGADARPRPSARRGRVADALVAGDRQAAVRAYLSLREQGERVSGLLYWISQRLRTAHEVSAALDAGEPPAQIKRRLRMPSRAADKLIADARRAGVGAAT